MSQAAASTEDRQSGGIGLSNGPLATFAEKSRQAERRFSFVRSRSGTSSPAPHPMLRTAEVPVEARLGLRWGKSRSLPPLQPTQTPKALQSGKCLDSALVGGVGWEGVMG